MGLTKSLPHPTSSGAPSRREPIEAFVQLWGYGLCPSLCNTKAKFAIKLNDKNGGSVVKRQSGKLSLKQLALILIPFISTIFYLLYLLFTKRYYTKKCLFSLLKACLAAFVSGVVLGLIGLFSYPVTAIISFLIIGITMNFVFFKSYNNTTNR